MSENKDIMKESMDRIKDIPEIKKNNITPLSGGVRELRGKIQLAFNKLGERKAAINAAREEAEAAQAETVNVAQEVISNEPEQPKAVETEPVTPVEVVQVEEKPVIEEKVIEEKPQPVAEQVVPAKETKTFIPPKSQDRPQGGYNQQQRPQNNNFNNNNRPQGGYNNTQRPNSGGFNNNNRPGGFNNNNNRPAGAGGGFAPRLPKADMPAPTAPKEAPKKKKGFERDDRNKAMNKRTLVRKGYLGDVFDEESARHHKNRKIKKQNDFTPNTVVIESAVITTEKVAIKTLAEKIGKAAVDIVKKLFELDQMYTVNSIIDYDTAELVAMEFGIPLEYKPDKTAEDKLNDMIVDNDVSGEAIKRPPVVAIMGHVDHGKTSLLDYIRKTKVASGEAGGITQHIGAYTIDVNGEAITFLDTPGHEAFTSMRKRGAKATDIAIIVVAADDGIMPQTIEAISHAKEAGVSIIVAVNKMDKATANPDKIMQQMTQYDIVPEEWGGDVIVVPVSAKTGMGVDNLLEAILLVAEVKELTAVKDCKASGSVIEARLDKGVGPVATVLVQNGTLKVSDYVVAGTCVGKIRALIDCNGKRVKEATPSYAVAVQGFSEVPNAGDQLIVVKDEKLAKQVAQERANRDREDMQMKSNSKSLEDMFKNYSDTELKSLAIVIKGDVQGSVEAVKQSMIKLSDEMRESGVIMSVIHSGVGAVNESDVMLADAANAIIIAFNVRPEPKAKALAEKSKVDVRQYRIIYDVIDDVTKAMKGMLDPVFREEELGHALVKEIFRITNVGTIAGCEVTDGRVSRNAKFRLIRDNVVVYDGNISSMKRNKDEVKEVVAGYECGIGLENFNDIKVGDIIEAFLLKEENI